MLQAFQTTPPTSAPIRIRFELTAIDPLHGNPPPDVPGVTTPPLRAGARERERERDGNSSDDFLGVSTGGAAGDRRAALSSRGRSARLDGEAPEHVAEADDAGGDGGGRIEAALRGDSSGHGQ